MRLMKVVVDSNVFISLFAEKDPLREMAVKAFSRIREKKLQVVISTLVLPEVCSGIVRVTKDRTKTNKVKKRLVDWINSNWIFVEELTKRRMLSASDIAIEFGLKGADSIIVSLAKELNAPLLTFDEEINKKVKDKIKLFKL
jgi:predicted nucleic acid-binding protein